MSSTNYTNTLILVAPDCKAEQATTPPKPESVAGRQYQLLHSRPYELTSDELLFEVHCQRHSVEDREAEHASFFAKSQACLRASPLPKQYGWGVHHDAQGKIALVARESGDYARLDQDPAVKSVAAMRSQRA